jgi:hypothetical protein
MTGQEPSTEWPVCPGCNRARTAVCPVCGAAGSNFDVGWGRAKVGTAELNEATSSLAAEQDEDAPRLLVICPACDESFRARFLARCEWCGHTFRSGVAAPDAEEQGSLSLRMIATIVALAILVAAVFAYFAFLVR